MKHGPQGACWPRPVGRRPVTIRPERTFSKAETDSTMDNLQFLPNLNGLFSEAPTLIDVNLVDV